jgi:DNA invertase Pin-like site-specific DNA recombinase
MLGVFAEFEREMIVARVNAGLARAKETLKRDGKFTSKAGVVRTHLGPPTPRSSSSPVPNSRKGLASSTRLGWRA